MKVVNETWKSEWTVKIADLSLLFLEKNENDFIFLHTSNYTGSDTKWKQIEYEFSRVLVQFELYIFAFFEFQWEMYVEFSLFDVKSSSFHVTY